MIMKRKNIILSIFLSFTILTTAACKADEYSTSFVSTSESSTTVTSSTELQSETTEKSAVLSTEEEKAETTSAETSETMPVTSEETLVSENTEAITEEAVITTESAAAPETSDTALEETTAASETTVSDVTVEISKSKEETTMSAAEITEKKYIALTFDDGPNTTTTNEVLDVLEQYGIKGSFFLIGNNINAESEKSVKRAYDMGCDIGNHSKSHPYMNEMSVDEIKAEIEYVDNYILEITGEKPKFFRPPYIAINNTMFDTIDLTFISGFGCNDWDDKVTAERRAKVIIRQAQDGGIILLHDAQGNSKTVEALHTIIPELQAQGYEFVTLTELFEIKGVTLSPDDGNLYSFVG